MPWPWSNVNVADLRPAPIYKETRVKQMVVNRFHFRRAAACLVPLALIACSAQTPLVVPAAPTQTAWTSTVPSAASTAQASVLVPHQGSVQGLSQWWAGLGDSTLVALIDKAQALSPSVEAAKTRMAQARASQIQAGAQAGPLAQGSLGLSRGVGSVGDPVASGLIASAQASWEIDLFGGLAATQAAAKARLSAGQANWHDARVSLAAEVARSYFALKTCERLAYAQDEQAKSLAESVRLSQLLVKAGLLAATQATGLSVAQLQSQSALAQTRAQCTSARIGLVALTGESAATLQRATQVQPAAPLVTAVALPSIPELPAQLLLQRPDVWAAEQEATAARHEVGASRAQHYPRLSLNGSLSGTRASVNGATGDFLTWSLGPLGLSMPLWDGGQRDAATQVAVAQFELALVNYGAKVRQAVGEVDDALNRLNSSQEQGALAKASVQQLADLQAATLARLGKGLASQTDVEDAKRQWLSSQANLYALENERINAWIALYRALGGGWQAQTASAPNPQ